MAKAKQSNFWLDEKSLNKLEIIMKMTRMDKSNIIRMSIEKLYNALKKNKYDLDKLEL